MLAGMEVAGRAADAGTQLERARAGDVGGFDELVRDLLQPAYRLALTLLRDPGQAEDAVQEATLKAWRNAGRLRDAGAVRPWFMAIVANQCRSALRRRRLWLPLDLLRERTEARAADELATRRVGVGRAMRALGTADRLAVYLYYYLDMEVTEAARAAGISEAAFRSRLARATRRMRPLLVAEDSDG